jgi:IS5 family transposase
MQSQVAKLSGACRKTAADLSQGLRFTQMAKQHADQLIPARETFRSVFGTMRANYTRKCRAFNQLYNLRKQICTFERHMSLRICGTLLI